MTVTVLRVTQKQIGGVARAWKRQYCAGGEWADTSSGSSRAVYKRLLALTPTATAKDVADVIGNYSWVGHLCKVCWEYAQVSVEFSGRDEDFIICAGCITVASNALSAESQEAPDGRRDPAARGSDAGGATRSTDVPVVGRA